MGVCVILGLLCVIMSTLATQICEWEGCNCTFIAHSLVRANCSFNKHQVVDLDSASLPRHLQELDINSCLELNVLDSAFSRLALLRHVRLRNVEHLRIRRNAFNQLATKQTHVELTDCGKVLLETNAFRGVQGPLVALIARCTHVIIESTAFSWLLAITLLDVTRLDLAEKSFSFEKPRTSPAANHGPATTVLLQNVTMQELPSYVFPTPAAELRLINVDVRTIKRDAFCAIQLSSVIIQNSSLHRIETGSFNERTFIENLELDGIRVRTISSNAILGAIQRLTIQHSRLVDVVGGAVNLTVASVTLYNNVFEKIRSRGFNFKSWNQIHVDSNVFQVSETDAFSTTFQYLSGSNNRFTFTRNQISDFGPGAFRFASDALDVPVGLDTVVGENRFTQGCRCHLDKWIRDQVLGEQASTDSVEWMFNTSYCIVDALLAKCFKVPQGFISIKNYSDIVCGDAEVIECQEAIQGKIAISVVQNGGYVPDAEDNERVNGLDREKKVLALIFLIVMGGMAGIVLISLLMWTKRKGYCLQARALYMPSTTSCLTMFHRVFESFRGGTGIVAAGSISRLNVNEYNEQQRAAMLATEDVDQEEYVPVEDKWTQTLPEELTQELLQSLREKLDDPENYSEARDMIEHLYDLIKVEESCSNNNTPSTSETIQVYDDAEENLYDVIQPPRRSRSNKRTVCHVGTRAPSPDKLLPAITYAQISRSRGPDVSDYAQPRDHQPQHLYAELPGGGLPPAGPAPRRGPARPVSFLRALGETMVKIKVGDYSQPTDSTLAVHEYSELSTALKMANRPLPSKPDQGLEPGEGTSLAVS